MHRRQFLDGFVATAALGGCGEVENKTKMAPPPTWVPDSHESGHAFPQGVQAGDATVDSVRLSVLTDARSLDLVVVQANGSVWTEVDRIEDLTPVDGALQVEINGLEPDSSYAYSFFGCHGHSPVGAFQTAIPEGSSRVIRFGATSCIGAKPCTNLSWLSTEDLDFFCLLGDTVYADSNPAAVTLDDYRAKWREALRQPGLWDLTASTALIATLDDHEVRNNWTRDNIGECQRLAATAAFREALPQGVGPTGDVWRKLSWGDALDVLVLDSRSFRSGGRYLGADQLAWLQEELLGPARFKVILNSVPITAMDGLDWSPIGYIDRNDGWHGFQQERSELLTYIADQGIEGVLWLSGDHHWGQIGRVDPEGGVGRDMYEVLCGPSGSGPGTPGILSTDDQIDVLLSQNSATVVELHPEDGTAHVMFVGDDGSTLADRWLVV